MLEKTYTNLNGEYLKNNPTWHVEDSPWKAKQILKMLNRNSIHPKFVAEIGCGAGEILNQLHLSMPKDVHFVGYDISMDAINLANERIKDRLSFKNDNFFNTEETFDLLLVIDVIEHVENYFEFIYSCKGKAKNIIFHIPLDISIQTLLRNKLMLLRKTYGHLHFFVKETALATLVDAGYDIVDFFYTAGDTELQLPTLASKLAYIPRKVLFKLNKDLSAKVLGGYSLLILVK